MTLLPQHHDPAMRIRTCAGNVEEFRVAIALREDFGHVQGKGEGNVAIHRRGRAERRCTSAVETGVEWRQTVVGSIKIGEIAAGQLPEFCVPYTGRVAAKRHYLFHVRGTQAL